MKKLLKNIKIKKTTVIKINSQEYEEFDKVLKKNFTPAERNKLSLCKNFYEFIFFSKISS